MKNFCIERTLFTCTHSLDAACTSIHRESFSSSPPSPNTPDARETIALDGFTTTQQSECTSEGWLRYNTRSAPY